jgi:hypothetical protein
MAAQPAQYPHPLPVQRILAPGNRHDRHDRSPPAHSNTTGRGAVPGAAHHIHNQTDACTVQHRQKLAQTHRDALGDTRRDPQHPARTVRARQPAAGQRPHHSTPRAHRQHNIPGRQRYQPHEPTHEIIAAQPPAVPNQQPNGHLQAAEHLGARPQRRRQLIEARSVSGIPSTRSRIRP